MVVGSPVRVLAFCLLLTGMDAAVFPPDFEAELGSYIDVTMRCRHVPGLTLAVVKDSEVWTQGFGTADFSTGRKVNETTLFNIGSVTKSFTMTLLGILLTEKGLDWTAKVTELLPPGYKFVDDYRTRELTLKDLLCHRTGLARLDVGWVAGIPPSLSRAELCKRMAYLPESKPTRDTFIYNNYMYMVLGHVAETLGGDTWENLMTSKVLLPIGMTGTRFLLTPTDVLKADVAHPYAYGKNDHSFQNATIAMYSLHPVEPAGAIMSNAVDMAKYMRFHMDVGKTASGVQLLDKDMLSDAYIAQMTTTAFPELQEKFITKPQFPISDTQIAYGYAWVDSTYRGYRRFWHIGGLFSYKSTVMIFPEEKIAIYGNVNGPNFKNDGVTALDTIPFYIADRLLGERPWLNKTTSCTYPEPWKTSIANNTATTEYLNTTVNSLKQYTGSFGNHIMPDINITLVGSQLVVAIGSKLHGVLHKVTGSDKFKFVFTHPVELTSRYSGDNKSSVMNVAFSRAAGDIGDVTSCTFTYEVDVTYTKGTSILQNPDAVTPGIVG